MLHLLSIRRAVLLCCAVGAAGAASAVTLGNARGTVLIGRPLELSIPATLDAADGEAPCLEGELFHADTRVPRAPTVRWEPGAAGQGTVRVSSSLPVDEPMITLTLRAGCRERVTRRYVMLADLPPEMPAVVRPAPPMAVAPSVAPPGSQAAPAAPAPRAATPVVAPGAAVAPAPSAPASQSPAPRASRADARAPGRATSSRAAAPAPANRPRPRLQLEPLELAAERDPTLRLSTELLTQPAVDPQGRQAAAALWQVLRKGPEEAMQEMQRMNALEREMAALREATRQNAAAVAQMRELTEKARAERNQVTTLAIVLGGLLVLALAVVGWLWFRARRDHDQVAWYAGHSDAETSLAPAPSAPASMDDSVPAPLAPAARRPLWPRKAEPAAAPAPDIKAHHTMPVPVQAQAPAPAARVLPPLEVGLDFQASQNTSLRTVRVDELIDIQDKADFFLSIGQHDQAIAVLAGHVHDQVETSPLPWLDLLDLYHKLDRRQEYETLRAEFRQHFAAAVPDFDQFHKSGAGLEQYSRALSRIVALWPSPRVLQVIEEAIFRRPGASGSDTFSLEAYRELILLYNIARDITPEADSSSGSSGFGRPTSFPHTDLQPLAALDLPELQLPEASARSEPRPPAEPWGLERTVPPGPADAWALEPRVPPAPPRERLMVPPASPRLGVDIDLSEPHDSAPGDVLDPDLYLDFDTTGPTLDPANARKRR